jgi:hypothetical protein
MLKFQFKYLKSIVIAAILLMLIPLHKDSFVVKFLGSVDNFSSLSQLILSSLFCISMFLFFLRSKNKFSSNSLYLVSILFITFLFSFLIFFISSASLNGFFALFFMPLFYLFLLEITKNNYFSWKERHIITFVLFIWCFFPVIDSYFNNNWLLYSSLALHTNSTDFSFSGYALHRNVYGLYCTISALLILFSQYNKVLRFVLFIAILFAIIISQSRTALLVVLIFTFIHLWINLPKLRWLFSIFGSLFLFCIFILLNYLKDELGMRDLIQSDDSRQDIIKKLLSKYHDSLLFGSGDTSFIDLGLEVQVTAHNFIVQTLLDYGIFNMFIFILIVIYLAIKLSYQSRMLFLTLIAFGLTQPYFSFGIPNIYMFFIFSLSIVFSLGNSKLECLELLKTRQ